MPLRQFPLLTQPQQGLQQNILSMLPQLLSSTSQQGFDFKPIAEQARTQFQQQTIPSIAERFTGLNAQGSSAFKQSLGQAGAGLEQGLGALQSQYGLQQQGLNQQLLSNLLHHGLQPSMENVYFPRQQSFSEGFFPSLAQGGLSALLKLLTGGLL